MAKSTIEFTVIIFFYKIKAAFYHLFIDKQSCPNFKTKHIKFKGKRYIIVI